MTRLVLLIILGVVATHYLPESRETLYGIAEPLVNPLFRLKSEGEMREVARQVRIHERENYGQIPDLRRWPQWLERHFSDGESTDSWGTMYHLYARGDSFQVVSFGPDGLPGTGDEFQVARALARPRSRR